MEFGTIEAIIGCVEAGLGITLLPRGLVQDAERAGRLSLHRVPASDAKVDILFVRRCDTLLFRALEAFIRYAVKPSEWQEAAE
jgi:DNA-binding transcriptional LysR family regulator